MSFIADSQQLGHLPLQDHDPTSDVAGKANVLASRVLGRHNDGRWIVEGHTEGGESPQRTVGDVRCAIFVDPIGDKRPMGAWSFALPSIAQNPSPAGATLFGSRSVSVNPVRNSTWGADDRLKVDTAAVHPDSPSVPRGHPGVTIGATNEDAQDALFFPSQVPLIAANRDGSPRMSSWVYDVNAANGLDRVHAAQLHSSWNTIVLKKGCSFLGSNAIAWQLGVDGLTDRSGFGLVVERAATTYKPKPVTKVNTDANGNKVKEVIGHPSDGPEEVAGPKKKAKPPLLPKDPKEVVAGGKKVPQGKLAEEDDDVVTSGGKKVNPKPTPPDYVLGYVSHLQSGPLQTGGTTKVLGFDDAGAPVTPVGITTKALFRGLGHDAPLEFDSEPYVPPSTFSHLTRVWLRHDSLDEHDYVCGSDVGKWKWEAEIPSWIIPDKFPPPKKEPPPKIPPKLPPYPPWIPKPDPEDFIPGPGQGGHEGIGGGLVPGDFERGWPGGVSHSIYDRYVVVGADEEQRRKVLGNARAWPTFSATTRHAGGAVFRAFATATGEFDLSSGGPHSDAILKDQACAPDVAAIVPVGKGTGRWCEWSYIDRGAPQRQPRGEGGIAVLPARYAAPERLREVLDGVFDPLVGGESPETQVSLFVPGALASIDFAHPTGGFISGRGLAGGRTGSGIRAHQTVSGLTLQGLDGSGSEIANQTWSMGTEGNLTHRRDAASATTGTLHQIETSGGAPVRLRGVSRRGTLASPSATQSGDELLSIQSYGTSSIGADLEGAQIVFTQAGAISGSVLPSKIEFKAKGSGSAFITSYVDHEGFHGSIDAGDAYVARLFKHNGNLVGFYGVTAVTQPATPTTLADVIAALQALGLVA